MPSPSATRVSMPVRVLPGETNPVGNMHGGAMLRYLDIVGAMAAMRHCRTRVVTASVDRVDFLAAARLSEVLTFHAQVNMVGRASMEVGVRAEAEDLLTGEKRHAMRAYMTFVSVDDAGKALAVPELVLETGEDRRRCAEALARRERRQEEKKGERKAEEGRAEG